MKTPQKFLSFDFFKHIDKWQWWSDHTMLDIFFIGIGVIALFFIVINFFTSLGESHNPPKTEIPLSYDDLQSFENILAFTVNSTAEHSSPIEILHNGAEFLPDFLKEIKKAKKSIYVSNYIWTDGEFGNTLLKALTEKANEGVQVRLLIDAVGSHGASKELIKKLEENGGKVKFFRPLRWWNVNRIDRRAHFRDIVIDGKISYIGGIAIDDTWMGDASDPKSWHDFMFKGKDVMAWRMENIFVNIWSQTTGEILEPSPQPKSVATPSVEPKFISLFSAPAPDTSSNMEHFMWLSIMAAKKSIHITNPYLLPSKSLKEALEYKAKQGVEVILLGPGDTDANHVKVASQAYYKELLKSGIKIYEYQPSRIHAKTMIVDNVWAVIGSANFDNRSSRINLELIVGISDPLFAKDLDKEFQTDLAKSKEITKESWEKESVFRMPISYLSMLFIRQY